MPLSHKNVLSGKWQEFSLAQQLGNIGSEYMRFFSAYKIDDKKSAENSSDRFLELLDATIQDKRWEGRLKEFLRLREVFCSISFDNNIYGTKPEILEQYFLPFAIMARK